MLAFTSEMEKRLWDAADTLRANSGLASHEYSTPVLGLIFLRFAEVECELLNAGARELEERISENVTILLERV